MHSILHYRQLTSLDRRNGVNSSQTSLRAVTLLTPHPSLVPGRLSGQGCKHSSIAFSRLPPATRQVTTWAVSGTPQHAQHAWQDKAAAWLSQPAVTPNSSATARWQLLERRQFAGGWLELLRWEDAPSNRLLRVWLPPGYYQQPSSSKHVTKQPPPPMGWPVMYLNDAQNLFEDKLSFSGRSWSAAHTAQHLITSGKLPPFVIVGMDHAGAQRSFEYTPYKPGTGPKGWRSDAANWPGGGVAEYVDRVVQQYASGRNAFHVIVGHEQGPHILVSLGGDRHQGVFDSLLVESPSLWIENERFLRQDIAKYSWRGAEDSCYAVTVTTNCRGKWPPHIYAAMGGSEYKNDGSSEFSQLLVAYLKDLVALLDKQGASKSAALKWRVVDQAGHNEAAWADRLPEALQHLCSHWTKLNEACFTTE